MTSTIHHPWPNDGHQFQIQEFFFIMTWHDWPIFDDAIFHDLSWMIFLHQFFVMTCHGWWKSGCQILMSFGWSNCSVKKDGESFISDLKTSIFRHTDVPNDLFHFSYVYSDFWIPPLLFDYLSDYLQLYDKEVSI